MKVSLSKLFLILMVLFSLIPSVLSAPEASCFAAGTKILMSDGTEKEIENIKAGDKIFSWDFEKKQLAIAQISDTWAGPHEDNYIINGHIYVTSEHPFWTKEKGWAAINPSMTLERHGWSPAKLEVGQHLMDNGGNYIEVSSITSNFGKITTYNLIDIQGYHNYFAEGVLVHNKDGDDPPGDDGDDDSSDDDDNDHGGGGGSSECYSGQSQTQGCGYGGTRTRICYGGSWGPWGPCVGQGCAPGSTQTQTCGTDVGLCQSGTQERTCNSNFQWGSWGTCVGEIAPVAETCDSQDNDCDGSADEDGICGPTLSIPDHNISENSGFNDNLVDLYTYTTDPNTPLAGLFYFFILETNPGTVTCSLDSNRYIDCTAMPNQLGYSDITIMASDGSDTITDTFRVTITEVDDPPTLNIPDQSVLENSGFNNDLVDLNSFTNDPDSPLTSLLYTFVSETNPGIVQCNLDANRYIDCTTQLDQVGYSDVTISLTDGTSVVQDTFRVTVIDVNEGPIVNITHPDSAHNNFVEDFYVNLIASATDPENDPLTYTINWGNGYTSNGVVASNVINELYAYPSTGTYTITVTAFDGISSGSDQVDVNIWQHGFNITDLMSYNNSDYTNQDQQFYRNEPLYIGFNVIQQDLGFPVPNNVNQVYMYNRDTPSNIYDLTEYNGIANGVNIINGQPAIPDGSYYYYIPFLPLTDDVLGWNIVFVFSQDGVEAGQEELEIEILNNPIQLTALPSITLNQTNGSNIYYDLNLSDYVNDIETPDAEIVWTFTGMVDVVVEILAGNVARFSAALGWEGLETLIGTADDTDGSTESSNFNVASGTPDATLLTPNCGELIYGTYNITWTATDPQADPIAIYLDFSDNNGFDWYTIDSGLPNTGYYLWNTIGLPQGTQYLVRVTAVDSGGLPDSDVSDCPFTILSSPDGNMSVEIIADKTSGERPLEVQFDSKITQGNAPYDYKWDFNNDGVVDSTAKNPKARFEELGTFLVTLTVTDFDGDTASDSITINTLKRRIKTPRKKIHLTSLNFVNDRVKAGNDLVMFISFSNQGNYKIKGATATVMIPELALRKKIGRIDAGTNQEISRKFVLEIPADTPPGFYDVMVTIYDHGLKRVKYRPIEII